VAAPKSQTDPVQLETTQLQPSAPLEMPQAPIEPARSKSMQPTGTAKEIITALPVQGPTAESAVAMLAAFQADTRVRAKQIAESDDDKYQYYVRCRRHAAPGIFLTKNPHGSILTNHDWFASYKGVNESWDKDIWCQECLQYDPTTDEYAGVQFPLAGIQYVPTRKAKNTAFSVEGRYLFRYPKDPELFAAMAVKGNALHRGVRMAADAMNHGLPADVVTREVTRG
jgi:hypothetical protein